MYSNGEGYSAILDALHRAGCRTKNGNEFQKNSLYSILTNKKYRGLYVFNRSAAKDGTGRRNTHQEKDPEDIISIEGGCPQLIDSDTFSKVQRRIQNNKHAGGRRNAKTNYLLSGKVCCQECGKAMVGNSRPSGRNKIIYSTYRCPTKRHSCNNKEINRNYLESYTIYLLEKHIFNTAALKRIATQIDAITKNQNNHAQESVATIQAKLTEVNAALSNVADAVAAGLLSDALITRLKELEQQKATLEASLQVTPAPPIQPTIDPHLILSQYLTLRNSPASPAYKEMIANFISEISVGRYTVTIALKTGLGMFPALDTTVTVRRQEIYTPQKRPS